MKLIEKNTLQIHGINLQLSQGRMRMDLNQSRHAKNRKVEQNL